MIPQQGIKWVNTGDLRFQRAIVGWSLVVVLENECVMNRGEAKTSILDFLGPVG